MEVDDSTLQLVAAKCFVICPLAEKVCLAYDTIVCLVQDMASQVIVVKHAMHAEASRLFGNPHYAADAFDAQFCTALI